MGLLDFDPKLDLGSVMHVPTDQVRAYQAMYGLNDLGPCDCGQDHGGEKPGGDVPKLRDGGPVTKTVFNRVTQPVWEVASRTVPEVLLPTVTAATLGDGLVEGG
ncbi:hypothetical protein [Rhodococcus koreensis]